MGISISRGVDRGGASVSLGEWTGGDISISRGVDRGATVSLREWTGGHQCL